METNKYVNLSNAIADWADAALTGDLEVVTSFLEAMPAGFDVPTAYNELMDELARRLFPKD